MFSSRKSSAPAVSAGTPDPQFNYVTALLHGDGTNGAQNNTFVDSSSNAFTITRNGTPTQGSFSPYGSLWSLYTDQRSYITIPASSDFDLISTDFTIEFWLNPIAFNTMTYAGSNIGGNGMATATNGWGLGFDGSGTTVTQISYFTWSSGTVTLNSFNSLSLTLGNWYHVAIVRNGSGANNLTLYVNGVKQGSSLTASTYSTAGSTFVLGSGSYIQNTTYSGNAAYYISNFRLSKSAVYTSNFTPSTTPLTTSTSPTLLLCQSNCLINNGSNTGAITSSQLSGVYSSIQRFNPFLPTSSQAYSTSVIGGSGYFNGSGDFLTTTMTGGLGSGDFTVEIWVYATSIYNYITWFSTTRDLNGFSCGTDANGALVWVNGVGGSSRKWDGATTSGNIIRTNSWNHVAFVRSSNLMRVYLNGTATVTTSSASSVSDTANYSNTNLSVGQLNTGGENPTGYLCDGRITTSALYTANFTPPTAPLTAVSGVRLLNNYTNGAIYDNAMMEDWITVGSAQISTFQKKYGTGSLYFNGSSNLYTIGKPIYDFYNGDFTVEAWVYVTSVSATQIIASCGPTGGSGFSAWTLQITSTGYLLFDTFYGGTEQFITATTNPLSANTWYHVAYTKASGTSRLFVSGNSCTFSGSITQQIISGGYPLTVGAGSYTGYTSPMTGYIDDLRITNGYARYTANFTPPTAALPNYGR